MAIQTLTNSIYKITDFTFQHDDQGYYLSMNLNHCDAAVLCISHRGRIGAAEIDLTDRELAILLRGNVISRGTYTLQGITRQALAASFRYRVDVSPPAFVQVWGLKETGLEVHLFVPDCQDGQCAAVPQLYNVDFYDGQMEVRIDNVSGYHDGDLLYQVGDHLPIPIPACALNRSIPLPVGVQPNVFPDERVLDSYRRN